MLRYVLLLHRRSLRLETLEASLWNIQPVQEVAQNLGQHAEDSSGGEENEEVDKTTLSLAQKKALRVRRVQKADLRMERRLYGAAPALDGSVNGIGLGGHQNGNGIGTGSAVGFGEQGSGSSNGHCPSATSGSLFQR